jgi:hypothetical protein
MVVNVILIGAVGYASFAVVYLSDEFAQRIDVGTVPIVAATTSAMAIDTVVYQFNPMTGEEEPMPLVAVQRPHLVGRVSAKEEI